MCTRHDRVSRIAPLTSVQTPGAPTRAAHVGQLTRSAETSGPFASWAPLLACHGGAAGGGGGDAVGGGGCGNVVVAVAAETSRWRRYGPARSRLEVRVRWWEFDAGAPFELQLRSECSSSCREERIVSVGVGTVTTVTYEFAGYGMGRRDSLPYVLTFFLTFFSIVFAFISPRALGASDESVVWEEIVFLEQRVC